MVQTHAVDIASPGSDDGWSVALRALATPAIALIPALVIGVISAAVLDSTLSSSESEGAGLGLVWFAVAIWIAAAFFLSLLVAWAFTLDDRFPNRSRAGLILGMALWAPFTALATLVALVFTWEPSFEIGYPFGFVLGVSLVGALAFPRWRVPAMVAALLATAAVVAVALAY